MALTSSGPSLHSSAGVSECGTHIPSIKIVIRCCRSEIDNLFWFFSIAASLFAGSRMDVDVGYPKDNVLLNNVADGDDAVERRREEVRQEMEAAAPPQFVAPSTDSTVVNAASLQQWTMEYMQNLDLLQPQITFSQDRVRFDIFSQVTNTASIRLVSLSDVSLGLYRY